VSGASAEISICVCTLYRILAVSAASRGWLCGYGRVIIGLGTMRYVDLRSLVALLRQALGSMANEARAAPQTMDFNGFRFHAFGEAGGGALHLS